VTRRESPFLPCPMFLCVKGIIVILCSFVMTRGFFPLIVPFPFQCDEGTSPSLCFFSDATRTPICYILHFDNKEGLLCCVNSPFGTPVRGIPYASDAHSSSASASDSRLPSASAPATSSLFRNAFGRMTSYATRSRPASAPDRMVSRDVA